MKYYDVNGVRFSFNSQFKEYFIDNIEKYEIDKCKVNHSIETLMVKEITTPIGTPSIQMDSRFIFESEQGEIIVIYKNKQPVILIEKDFDYKKILLYIKEGLNGVSEIEYVYTGIIFMELCLFHSIQSLHGSAIQFKNQVIIFSGPSGVGKSTHVEYWKELDSTVKIINDDKPLLSLVKDRVFASGSPWSGKTRMNENISLPLHSIVFLEQGKTNEIIKLSKQEKIIHIMRNINRPRQSELWNNTLKILEAIVEGISMYKAIVTNSIDAADVVKKEIGV